MPRPNPGEEKNAYISRCVRQVMGEGAEQKAALGKCFGMWDYYHKDSLGGLEMRIEDMDTKIRSITRGLLKVPDGKTFANIGLDHYLALAKCISKSLVLKGLVTLEKLYGNRNPESSKRARTIIDSLKKSAQWVQMGSSSHKAGLLVHGQTALDHYGADSIDPSMREFYDNLGRLEGSISKLTWKIRKRYDLLSAMKLDLLHELVSAVKAYAIYHDDLDAPGRQQFSKLYRDFIFESRSIFKALLTEGAVSSVIDHIPVLIDMKSMFVDTIHNHTVRRDSLERIDVMEIEDIKKIAGDVIVDAANSSLTEDCFSVPDELYEDAADAFNDSNMDVDHFSDSLKAKYPNVDGATVDKLWNNFLSLMRVFEEKVNGLPDRS